MAAIDTTFFISTGTDGPNTAPETGVSESLNVPLDKINSLSMQALKPKKAKFELKVVENDILPKFRYTSIDDIYMRLVQTYVHYKNKPVYITDLDNMSANCHLRVICTEDYELNSYLSIHTSDKNLDIDFPKIGYVNRDNKPCLFLYKNPLRKQKQGLFVEHLRFKTPQGSSTDQYPTSKEIFDMLNDRYPSVEEGIDRTKPEAASSCALSKFFALSKYAGDSRLRLLLRKNKAIGYLSLTDKAGYINKDLLLPKSKKYLARMLKNAGYE